jgi:hypothetical protein
MYMHKGEVKHALLSLQKLHSALTVGKTVKGVNDKYYCE